MVSTSLKELQRIEQKLNELANTAEQSDLQIINIINAQATHIQNLTALVITMHKKLFPEQHENLPDYTQPPALKSNLIVLK